LSPRAAVVATVLAALALTPAAARGQQPSRTVTVRVRVVDTAGNALQGAEITLSRGLKQVVAHGQSDTRGQRALAAPRVGEPIQVTARKLGYAPANQFVSPDDDTAIDVRLVMHVVVQTLAPVAVTARESILRKRNHLDSDDIENSPRPIFDGLDAITKLRPDIVDPPENSPADPCGLFYLWVNGRRIFLPSDSERLDDPMMESRLKALAPAPPKWIGFALSKIKPEHIEEVTYKGCNDTSMEGVAGRNAAFIVLKPGIGYDWQTGTFVIAGDKTAAGRVARRERERADSTRAAEHAAPAATPPLPGYRHRLLGLYDESTGDPIAGAAVADTATGTTALTTATGTISLVFLPEGRSTIRIQKQGYASLVIGVDISPADTVPLTLVLGKTR
jgi:hypothetical protein